MVDHEILPLIDDPEEYTWTSPEAADYFTIYERDGEGLASALVDTPSLQAALAYLQIRDLTKTRLWTGEMFVSVKLAPLVPAACLTSAEIA